MTDVVPFGKRNWYPHMMPYDVTIWERFIEQFPDMYDHVSYDVKVGSLPSFDTTVNDATGGKADDLYKKKIDVVAYKGDQIDIIELKPDAKASAIGQLKLYRQLFIKEFNPPVMPKIILITDRLNADMQDFAVAEGVQIVVV